ncbi:MAG: FAD-binding oxidoreductase [Oscillatoriales cyanobacterium SM2_2_1]|nr:FAD-binding oxidoreductase [Oscillatoriales cyanobacterium SM2_2_1]
MSDLLSLFSLHVPTEPLTEAWVGRSRQCLAPDAAIPQGILFPRTLEELSKAVTLTQQHQWRFLPCGYGSKLDWGGLVSGAEVLISTQRLAMPPIHSEGDLTVTVSAGMDYASLQKLLAPARQFWAVDPWVGAFLHNTEGAPVSVGGIIATASTGSLRQRYGGVRDQVLGMTVVRADGQVAKSGGQVVKNVAGYDLMKLFTGSYGTLGVMATVTLRLYALPPQRGIYGFGGSWGAIAAFLSAVRCSAATPLALDVWLLPAPSVWVVLGTTAAALKEQGDHLVQLAAQWGLVPLDSGRLPTEPQAAACRCQVGILPARVGDFCTQIGQITPATQAQIHAGSGIGTIWFSTAPMAAELEQLRELSHRFGGYWTVLSAPTSLKQSLSPWDRSVMPLPLMNQVRQQFDPDARLCSHRFSWG